MVGEPITTEESRAMEETQRVEINDPSSTGSCINIFDDFRRRRRDVTGLSKHYDASPKDS